MKKIILFCITLSIFSVVYTNAQNENKIKITVIDGESQSPLPACIIKVVDSNIGYTTDKRGEAVIPIPYKVHLEVRYVGYNTRQIWIRPSKTKHYTVSLLPDNHLLKTIEIVENRTIRKNTSNIKILDKSTLNRQQNKSMADILSNITGCRVLSTGAMIEKPIVEGMSGSRIAIVNNNTKIAGQQWGDDHAPEIDIPSYAHVSVIKGAESVKYGASALGGVVLVNTDLNARERGLHVGFQSSYSTNGKMYGGSTFIENSISMIPNFRYRVGYKYYRSGDYHTPTYMLTNTGSRLQDIRADVGYHYGKMDIQSHFSYYDTEIGIFSGSTVASQRDLLERYRIGYPPKSALLPFSYHITYPKQDVKHLLSDTKITYALSSYNLINMKYSFQSDYRREYGLRLGKYKDKPDFAFRLYTQNINCTWKHIYKEGSTMELGSNFVYANNITDRNTGSVPIIPNYVTMESSLYTIGNVYIGYKTNLEAGIRYDHRYTNSAGYDLLGDSYGGVKTYDSMSGTLGIRSRYFSHQMFNANIGLAWRAPEMNELYSHGVHHGEAIYQQGDPNLKTEKAMKFTSGYRLDKNFLHIETNGFMHYIFDYIYDAPHFHITNGVKEADASLQNAGLFTKYFFMQSDGLFVGGDLTIRIGPWYGFDYTVRGEWIRAANLKNGGYFPNIPSDRYEQTLHYQYIWNRLHLQLAINHIFVAKQTRFDEEIDLLPDTPSSYQLINSSCSVTYDISPKHHIEFYVDGSNLANKLYKEYTDRLRYFMHEKGRDITIGLRYHF